MLGQEPCDRERVQPVLEGSDTERLETSQDEVRVEWRRDCSASDLEVVELLPDVLSAVSDDDGSHDDV